MTKEERMSVISDDTRSLALNLGDLHGKLTEQVPSLVTLAADEREQRSLHGLLTLRAHGVLTDTEVVHLSSVVHAIHATEDTAPERASRVGQIYQELITANAGPPALAIAGIASNSTAAAAQRVEDAGKGADIGDFSTPAECACAGAIVGATAGVIFGPPGVLAGALAGAAGGAIGGLIAQAVKA
jgi:hypothetical protein